MENELDAMDFEYKTLPCAMRRNRAGAWCGYVGIPAQHPLFGVQRNSPAECLTTLRATSTARLMNTIRQRGTPSA